MISEARNENILVLLPFKDVGCVCVQNNGECSRNAQCEYLGMGQRNCTCHRGYIGDGIDCRGTTNNVSHVTFDFQLTFEPHPPLTGCCSLSYRKCSGRRRMPSFVEC